MNQKEFEEIISKSESSVLDFKAEQYVFSKDKTIDKTDDFVKDIISFTNTIRLDSAYIIIGIEELSNGSKNFKGLNENVDDATFQQKIKDKVNPKPIFSYSTLLYQNKNFGIIEIPIQHYSEPITATKNFKSIDAGKVYFRRGSTNSEATISETIKINDWFRTLISGNLKVDLLNEIPALIARLNQNDSKLGIIAAEALSISKKIENEENIKFFKSELSGWTIESSKDIDAKFLKYRHEKVIVTPVLIDDIRFQGTFNPAKVYEDILKREDSDEIEIFFNQPVSFIEAQKKRFHPTKDDNIYQERRNIEDFSPNRGIKGEINIIHYNTFISLVYKIRQKYTDVLMNLI